MAKKLRKSPMELDLDSFLHTTSDDEDDDDLYCESIPHCTVDDILNDSNSSSSSSYPPPSSLFSQYQHRRFSDLSFPKEEDNFPDDVLVVSSKPLLNSPIDETLKLPLPSKSGLISRAKSVDFTRDSFSLGRRGTRSLSALFGSVISNAKPGAALAAATTALRSIPMPHPVAIKLRRAGSVSLLKSLDHAELGSSSGESEIISSVLNKAGATSGLQ